MMIRSWLSGIGLVGAVAATPAFSAQFIHDHFNNYGDSDQDINGVGAAGDGWASGWYSPTEESAGVYRAGQQLTISKAGYSNDANEDGTDDGSLQLAWFSRDAERDFDAMDGTIWISAIARVGVEGQAFDGRDAQVMFWLDRDETNSLIGIRNEGSSPMAPSMRYGGSDTHGQGLGITVDPGDVVHMLAKLEIDVDGQNDTLSYWFNPDLSSGEAGLGNPTHSQDGEDVFGSSLTTISFSGGEYSVVDQIRISNTETAFTDVTLVPEPATLSLIGLGASMVLVRERRRG